MLILPQLHSHIMEQQLFHRPAALRAEALLVPAALVLVGVHLVRVSHLVARQSVLQVLVALAEVLAALVVLVLVAQVAQALAVQALAVLLALVHAEVAVVLQQILDATTKLGWS